jgi:hypothetical protein
MAGLWCIRLVGPDELLAADNQEAAQRMADAHNDAVRGIIKRKPTIAGDGITEDSMRAVVEPWPYSAEAHARHLTA